MSYDAMAQAEMNDPNNHNFWVMHQVLCPLACCTPVTCPTREPEPHSLGEFPMTCYRCHIEADS